MKMVSVELCGGVHSAQKQTYSNFQDFFVRFIGICIGHDLGIGQCE